MRVCLDTNAYSRLMGGHLPLTQLLESADEVLVPATVLGELHACWAYPAETLREVFFQAKHRRREK